MERIFDIVVIGAGIGGLIAAQRYLELNPTASLLIIDRNKHVGGVYSRDRIYPGFYTQFPIGLAEFSDLKMPEPSAEDLVGDCFKARLLSQYLEHFAETMVHNGTTLQERIQFGVEVLDVKDEPDRGSRWTIRCQYLGTDMNNTFLHGKGATGSSSNEDIRTLKARKLIIAAGESSMPNIPRFPGQAKFNAPIIHSTNFGLSKLLEAPNINHIAIIGAGKSSADMLYVCLKSLPPSTTVHWIIRPVGAGPGFFAPLDVPSPYKNVGEAAQTRAMTLLQPCIFHSEGWWVWFLHRTWLGIMLVGWIFSQIDKEAKKRAGYTTRGADAEKKGFSKLEYNPGIFWQNNPAGALHHADFWDLIAERVVVHRADIVSMSEKSVNLSDGAKVQCDALLLGTGFNLGPTFLSEELKAKLGVPHHENVDSPQVIKKWNDLNEAADKTVLARFPILGSPPEHYLKQTDLTTWRLYRGIAPVNDTTRDIVFVNHLVSGNMVMNAEAHAHWAVAYLSNKMSLPSVAEMEKEIALRVTFCKRRTLSTGQLGNYHAFDMIAYIDLLMEDLGVDKVWKRKGTWGVNRPEDLGESWRAWKELRVE